MDANIKNGFTIIELMLFLAVSGMLLAGLMIGSGVAVSQQRYRDSVKSLQSVMQQQYSEVANVVNDRPDNLVCSSTGVISQSASTPTPRGTSDTCTIVGRFIQSHRPDGDAGPGEALHIQTVVASGDVDPNFTTSSDTDILRQYNITTDTSQPVVEEKLEWDNKMRISGINGFYGHQFSILIIRSPLSGNIRTYTVPGPTSSDPKNMINDYNLTADLTICVETADGSLVPGDGMAIRLVKNSSNQSGVQTISREAGNGC